MSKQYTWGEILDVIRTELDIRSMLYEVFSQKLYHPEAIKNQHLLNGEIELGLDFTTDKLNKIVCPFHNTTSMDGGRIFVNSNTFSCFSGKCEHEKVSFNVIDLYLMLRYNLTPDLLGTEAQGHEFKETIKELATMLDIEFNFESRKLTAEEKHAIRLQQIREESVNFFYEQLKTNKYAEEAMEYMVETRGFKYGVIPFETLVEKYKIGYAPSKFGWTYLFNYLRKKGFKKSEILEAGVVWDYQKKDKETGEKIGEIKTIDFFTVGVTMAYLTRGKVSNIYCRALHAMSDEYRHLRLSGGVEQPINFDEARKYKDIIITEGEFSWLALISLGYENVLGNRGTNGMGKEHVKMLKSERIKSSGKRCSTIYLCFDPDEAGIKATAKTGRLLEEEGFDVRIIRLPSWQVTNEAGEVKTKGDPNDLLVNYKDKALEKFEECKANSISFEAFMILHTFEQEKPKTNVERRAAFKKVREYIENTPKEELIFILNEVVELMNLNKTEADWLLQIWTGITPNKEEEKVQVHEKTSKPWVLLTNEDSVQEYYSSVFGLNNVISANPLAVIKQLQDYPRIRTIVFDNDYPQENRDLFFKQLEGYKFYEMSSEVKNSEGISKQKLMQFIRPIDIHQFKIG